MQARLYEFIVRSFLATCSKPAVGFETRVEVDIAEELFDARGVLPGTCCIALLALIRCCGYLCIHTSPGIACVHRWRRTHAPCLHRYHIKCTVCRRADGAGA